MSTPLAINNARMDIAIREREIKSLEAEIKLLRENLHRMEIAATPIEWRVI